jgi:hypothetical protein
MKFSIFIASFLQIIDGLIGFLSLGFCTTSFTFKFIAWYELRKIKCRRHKLGKSNE